MDYSLTSGENVLLDVSQTLNWKTVLWEIQGGFCGTLSVLKEISEGAVVEEDSTHMDRWMDAWMNEIL